MKRLLLTTTLLVAIITLSFAQSGAKDRKIIEDSEYAKSEFLDADPEMDMLFDDAYGYIILPNVGKGGLWVGGASGNGVAFEDGDMIGFASMKQITIGLQAGGQAYREVVFFEDQNAFDRFKTGKIEMSAQVSAVAAASGISADAKYVDGVIVFTMAKGGLMYEASVGGQQFKFREN